MTWGYRRTSRTRSSGVPRPTSSASKTSRGASGTASRAGLDRSGRWPTRAQIESPVVLAEGWIVGCALLGHALEESRAQGIIGNPRQVGSKDDILEVVASLLH